MGNQGVGGLVRHLCSRCPAGAPPAVSTPIARCPLLSAALLANTGSMSLVAPQDDACELCTGGCSCGYDSSSGGKWVRLPQGAAGRPARCMVQALNAATVPPPLPRSQAGVSAPNRAPAPHATPPLTWWRSRSQAGMAGRCTMLCSVTAGAPGCASVGMRRSCGGPATCPLGAQSCRVQPDPCCPLRTLPLIACTLHPGAVCRACRGRRRGWSWGRCGHNVEGDCSSAALQWGLCTCMHCVCAGAWAQDRMYELQPGASPAPSQAPPQAATARQQGRRRHPDPSSSPSPPSRPVTLPALPLRPQAKVQDYKYAVSAGWDPGEYQGEGEGGRAPAGGGRGGGPPERPEQARGLGGDTQQTAGGGGAEGPGKAL